MNETPAPTVKPTPGDPRRYRENLQVDRRHRQDDNRRPVEQRAGVDIYA
ncbi:MAG: hypothetical protein ACXWM8_06840 [Candidatus Limnocylindrales bacterium]